MLVNFYSKLTAMKTLPKFLALVTCILLLAPYSSLKAQWVTIPDTNFVNWLQANIPSCMNGNQMDTTCSGVINRTKVNVANQPIADLTGIQYFDNLRTLWCYNSNLPPTGLLTSLPPLPQSLDTLDCDGNQLTSLSTVSSGLVSLNCRRNKISNPNFLAQFPQLKYVDCSGNQTLGGLFVFPSLWYLDCRGCGLTNLLLPSSLSTLYCSYNYLTSLQLPPTGLSVLECEVNELTTLPSLPSNLWRLVCGGNHLTSLPALPQSLNFLGCSNNDLTNLPSLPANLTTLYCDANNLTGLPSLPANLTWLYCSNNLITSLPELPDSLYSLTCQGNPLTCLPKLKRIVRLDFLGTPVSCLPNYGEVTTSYPALNTLPLCDIFNNGGCEVLWNISGKVYFDDNVNCSLDSNEVKQQNIKLQLWNGGTLQQQTLTGGEGFYSFDVLALGNYQVRIDTAGIPFNSSCPSNNTLNIAVTAVDSLKKDNDFATECKPGYDIGALSIHGWIFRPANHTLVDITAGDIAAFLGGQCVGVSGQVKIIINGPARYVNANGLTPSSVSGDTITWNVANFDSINSLQDFDITAQTDTTAPLGSQVCFTVSVTPTAGDNNPVNNSITHCFTVVGSFDPNDKQVYPTANIDTTQEWLTYTIRFQNTGTAEAQHIYIDDTLDANLDESSFQLLAYSHEPFVQIKGSTVRFNFPNINLPDSNANEPASHGYVQYKVKLNENLPIGTQISNRAYTYFDFNAPVVTNIVTNTIGLAAPVSISGSVLSEMGSPVPSVTMNLTGTDSATLITTNNGLFNFNVSTNGNYTIIPSKNNDVTVSNGITTLDILLTRKHILNIEVLGSPYKIIAADVNASSSISTIDIVLIRGMILGNLTSFPGGKIWSFVSSDFVFADSLTPYVFDSSRSYTNISSNQTKQNFTAIKLGDVNNSWDPATPKQGAIGNVQMAMAEYHAMTGDEIIIPVSVKDFRNISGYQFTLSWNPRVLSLVEADNKSLQGYYGEQRREEGLLTTIWYDESATALTLDDDATAFELKFKVIGENGSFSPIAIGSELTASEAYNENLDLLNIVATNGVVKVGDDVNRFHPSEGWNLSVVPNPFSNTTNIIFTLPKDKSVTLSIYDILGREVKRVKADYQAGEHSIEWGGDDEHGNLLSKGLYHVRMVAGESSLSAKAVMVR